MTRLFVLLMLSVSLQACGAQWFVYEPGYHAMTCTKFGCRSRTGDPLVNNVTSYAVVKKQVLESESKDGTFCPRAVANVNALPPKVRETMIKEIAAQRAVKTAGAE